MLNKSLDFLKILRELEKVERAVYRPNDKKENDVEHSYQVAMMSWFLANQLKLDLSVEKLVCYGLVHDLVEVYAGDTPAYSKKDKNTQETKKEREEMALRRIKNEFSHFDSLLSCIDSYENKQDKESVFVYEVDKLLPALNLYLDGGYGWKKHGLTFDDVKKEKRSKIVSTRELVNLLEETLSRFEEEKRELFESL